MSTSDCLGVAVAVETDDDRLLPIIAALSLFRARLQKGSLWDRTCEDAYISAQAALRSLVFRGRQ